MRYLPGDSSVAMQQKNSTTKKLKNKIKVTWHIKTKSIPYDIKKKCFYVNAIWHKNKINATRHTNKINAIWHQKKKINAHICQGTAMRQKNCTKKMTCRFFLWALIFFFRGPRCDRRIALRRWRASAADFPGVCLATCHNPEP